MWFSKTSSFFTVSLGPWVALHWLIGLLPEHLHLLPPSPLFFFCVSFSLLLLSSPLVFLSISVVELHHNGWRVLTYFPGSPSLSPWSPFEVQFFFCSTTHLAPVFPLVLLVDPQTLLVILFMSIVVTCSADLAVLCQISSAIVQIILI